MAPCSIGSSSFFPLRLSMTVSVSAMASPPGSSCPSTVAKPLGRAGSIDRPFSPARRPLHSWSGEQGAAVQDRRRRGVRGPDRQGRRRERRAHLRAGGARGLLAARGGGRAGEPYRRPQPGEARYPPARGPRARRRAGRLALEGARRAPGRRPPLPRGGREQAARGAARAGGAPALGAGAGPPGRRLQRRGSAVRFVGRPAVGSKDQSGRGAMSPGVATAHGLSRRSPSRFPLVALARAFSTTSGGTGSVFAIPKRRSEGRKRRRKRAMSSIGFRFGMVIS